MKQRWLFRPLLLSALIASIPAFYLVLTGTDSAYRLAGHFLYLIVAATIGGDIVMHRKKGHRAAPEKWAAADLFILLGSIASAWPGQQPWNNLEWSLRLVYCALVFVRMATLTARLIAPNRLLQICLLAILMLALAGAGFFWLEPRIQTYADGVWLAFITGATVGYGDLVPSTPASRIFAGFIVLLGYALFSVVTASIAALLVGEDEKRIGREMHSDLRKLREEIAALRHELRVPDAVPEGEKYKCAAPAARDAEPSIETRQEQDRNKI